MLLRLPYLAVSSVFTVMWLLPISDVDKDIEILTLRDQLTARAARVLGARGLGVAAVQQVAMPAQYGVGGDDQVKLSKPYPG